MILHCTPPYEQYTPNPALGYLKGFVQAKGIEVKNVYWNLILARKIHEFQRGLEYYAENTRFFPILSALYISRHLLTEDSGDVVTPLDLLYSSVLTKEEISEMIHSVREDIDQHIERNSLQDVSIAGFTLKILQWPMSYYIIGRLKKLNPDIRIVIGGIFNKSQGITFMKTFDQADFAIYGEGEYPLLHLITNLKEGTPLNDVPNLIYRSNSTITATGVQHECPPLDSYPFADHTDYFDTFRKYMGYPQHPVSIPIWGSRSCPWNKCKFCILNEGYHYRMRSPENVVEEIEYQSKKHNIDSFLFVDTEFAGTMKRFKILLKLLIQSSAHHKRKYQFTAEISPLFIDSKTAKLMQFASLHKVQIGFEAMTDPLLDKMQKRQQFVHNIQALKLGSQYGLELHGLNIIREIPTETRADILESCTNLRFLRFFLSRYPLIPGFLKLWKGTPFYKDVGEAERKNWNENPFWAEIVPTYLAPDDNKFEFFGFYKMYHDPQWDTFRNLLRFYIQQNYTYEWVEYPDGSSVEEKGPAVSMYMFDRNETDLLIFCDMIKNFSEIKERFSHLSEENLMKILHNLKDAELLYYDKDLTCVSVLEANKRKILLT